MKQPASNYKGMGGGPVSRRLSSARVARPTILRAPAGRRQPMPSYHPAKAPKLAKGSGGMSIMGMISRKQAMDKAEQVATVQSSKAGQSVGDEAEKLAVLEERMKRLGINLDSDMASNEGGM